MVISYSLVFLVAASFVGSRATPLDDYVNTPDPHYAYTYLTSLSAPGLTVSVLNMTSQKWLTEKVTRNPVWWHIVYVIIPDKLVYPDACFLWIDRGTNKMRRPKKIDDPHLRRMIGISRSTGSVTALIKQIPNQPIVFTDDPRGKQRTEDSIIAWTWMKFVNNGSNPEILLRLPMTKAVVRGMDTVTSFVQDLTDNTIDRFVVAGESKRGWTAWTTAAVDKRVVGIVPTVMDLLNLRENLHHHFRSLGGWTFAFKDYYNLNITKDLDSENMIRLAEVVDPFTYNDRYSTIPKLIVTTSGDEFFLPDDSYYYFDQLKGPKYLRIIPNAEHSLLFHEVSFVQNIRSFYLSVLEKAPLPTVTWTRRQTDVGGRIGVQTSTKPTSVIAFHARTTDGVRRDFRLVIKDPNDSGTLIHPVFWFPQSVITISDLEYVFELHKPAVGWGAFFVQIYYARLEYLTSTPQLTFDGVKNSTLQFTTEACIVPDLLPFPDCQGNSCFGTLV